MTHESCPNPIDHDLKHLPCMGRGEIIMWYKHKRNSHVENTDGKERLQVYDLMQKMILLVVLCPIDMGTEHLCGFVLFTILGLVS